MKTLINKKVSNSLKASALFGLLALPLQALASTLEAISFEPGVQDNFEVRLELDDTAGLEPEVYVIEQPARIVLDLPGVQNSVEQRQYALALSNAKDAVLLGTDDRTRLVLNLNSSTTYNYEVSGNELVLQVGSSEFAAAPATSQPQTESVSASAPASVSNVQQVEEAGLVDFEFRRGADGEGNLMLEFDTDQVNADITQRGSTISISFFGSEVADDIERVFDVQDFATPVGTVSVRQIGDEARVEIKTIDEFDYLAYQADSSYVVSVSPLTPEQEAEREREFAFVGERLSLNFQDIEVRSVLQLIADFTDLNLVASDTVSGNITLRLQNVPWDQALDIVLRTKGLDKRQEGNILLVAPLAEIAERERLEVEANKQLEELAPLVTEFIRIQFADAQDIFDLLTAQGSVTGNGGDGNRGNSGGGEQGNENLISARGSAVVDQRTNTIVLTDTEEKVAAFIEVVEQLDIPIRQVLIEARIVIANTDFRREIGVRWGGAGVRSIEDGSSALEFVGSRDGLADGGPIGFFTGQNDLDLADTLGVDLGVVSPTSSFALAFLSDSTFIDLELSALEEEGFGEIISQPKVVTGDQQAAEISAGQEIPFLEAASSGVATTSFREAVLSMEVTPQITPDGRVTLDLFVTQDSISDIAVDGQPVIDINEVRTQVLVDDGETLVLGGIFQNNIINDVSKVPVLGDLPIIGRAFRNKIISEEKSEVLFFITPKILSENLSSR